MILSANTSDTFQPHHLVKNYFSESIYVIWGLFKLISNNNFLTGNMIPVLTGLHFLYASLLETHFVGTISIPILYVYL